MNILHANQAVFIDDSRMVCKLLSSLHFNVCAKNRSITLAHALGNILGLSGLAGMGLGAIVERWKKEACPSVPSCPIFCPMGIGGRWRCRGDA
jgi:hypothetical protein